MTQQGIRHITKVTMSIESMKTVEIVEITPRSALDRPGTRTADDLISAVHPGNVLLERFMKPFDITTDQLARDTNMASVRIAEVVDGKRRMTEDTASRLSKYFGVPADYWLELQADFDAAEELRNSTDSISTNIPALQVS